jgi:hypothetical protein
LATPGLPTGSIPGLIGVNEPKPSGEDLVALRIAQELGLLALRPRALERTAAASRVPGPSANADRQRDRRVGGRNREVAKDRVSARLGTISNPNRRIR